MFTHFDPALAEVADRIIADYRSYFAGRWTADQLERYQLQHARETIDYVQARSPFYARHLRGRLAEEPGLSRASLEALPFTTKADLRTAMLDMLSRPVNEACFFYET